MHNPVENIAEELLAYLRRNPGAGETLEGIIHWWLIRQRYVSAANYVRSSLHMLEKDGWIKRIVNPDGVEIFVATTQVEAHSTNAKDSSNT